jgi:hypothetical protein
MTCRHAGLVTAPGLELAWMMAIIITLMKTRPRAVRAAGAYRLERHRHAVCSVGSPGG